MSEITICKLSKEEFNSKKISTWEIWEKEVSKFSWKYEETEECYIIEGDIEVQTDTQTFNIKAGDFVVFPKNLSCYWIIKTPVRKYYNFII